ncbi:MAG: Ferredoxin reductase [uncultured Quadrisphaera sp.]|uniref:Ferredoxin reductase n=1 Tax=uncultured Quadrisphaera sp. TaxID=904978 RepID=A0A6J4QGK7_9ACTN|nr:MAG: Ferredoxin reductase [uncultured Quadrisphaera sp.]
MSAGSVVVVGGGQAGFQTAASLRQEGYAGRVVLVGDRHPPYQRPPLSKAYLTGRVDVAELAFRPGDFYARHRIEVVPGPVTAVDRAGRTVALATGEHLAYEHLVLATGCRARRLGVPGQDLRGVHYLRDVDDASALVEHLGRAERLVVVGAGFIGLEVAAAARQRGAEVTVLEFAPRAMGRAVSACVGDFFIGRHRAAGTRVEVSTGVEALLDDGDGHVRGVRASTGEVLPADLVVVGVGVLPRTDLAEAAGLTVDGGVLVDDHLRSVDDAAVSAVGDCSRFVDSRSGARVRLESVQNAVDQGRCVAARIAGRPFPYTALPWFWTDQLGSKLQIAGLSAGHDRAVLVGDGVGGPFSVYCFAGQRLLAVESVDRPADHMAARRVLGAGGDALAAVTPDTVRREGFRLRDLVAA